MSDKELFSLLQKTILLLIIFFFLVIGTANLVKVIGIVVKIDGVIKQTLDFKEDIKAIEINGIQEKDYTFLYDSSKAHTAEELGFKNDIFNLNGTEWGEGYNILIVGSDKYGRNMERSRSDVIILIKINRNGKILSISIPRDSLITLKQGDNKGAFDKIGHSLYWGGLNYLKQNVEDYTGSRVDKVVVIDNFRTFEAFIAILGGIKTDKKLEGKLAVQWIRNRSFRMGDIERCMRQQVFMKRAVDKLWNLTGRGNYFLVYFIYDALKQIVYTDISKEELFSIIYNLKLSGFNSETDYITAVLPGRFGTYFSKVFNREVSCWIPDEVISQRMQLLFYSSGSSVDLFRSQKYGFLDYLKFDIKQIIEKRKKEFDYRWRLIAKKKISYN